MITSVSEPDHASLLTPRNHNRVGITVIKSSQRRTCGTMLALTSHYTATNAKHPRYAPGVALRARCGPGGARCGPWCGDAGALVRGAGTLGRGRGPGSMRLTAGC